MISVQEADFDIDTEYHALLRPEVTGAIVTFVGRVRDFDGDDKSFLLEHYPGMTERVLEDIEQHAHHRWPLIASTIIHRIGKLQIDDQIVFVGVSSAHRKAAFEACEFIIDILKTQAPFWKKQGGIWVQSRQSDQETADAWLNA